MVENFIFYGLGFVLIRGLELEERPGDARATPGRWRAYASERITRPPTMVMVAGELVEGIERRGERIAVEDGEVGQFSRREHPPLRLGKAEPSPTPRERAKRLKTAEPLGRPEDLA